MKKYLFTILFLFVVLGSNLYSEITSAGNDFWITFMPNYHNNKFSQIESKKYADSLFIFIGANKATKGTVEYTNKFGSFFQENFEITDPAKIYIFKICYYDFELIGYNDSGNDYSSDNYNEKITNMAFHIKSDDDVFVYGLNKAVTTSDAFLALPTKSLGTEYFVLSYYSDYSSDTDFLISRTPSQFAIVATEDNTKVEIEPSCKTAALGSDAKQTKTLNKGQVYLVQAYFPDYDALRTDLTGSYVKSDKPIAVFSGHQRTALPYNYMGYTNRSRDHIVEEMIPVSAWGMNAFIVPLVAPSQENNVGYDIYRVLSGFDNTKITINSSEVVTLNKGEFLERELDGPVMINGDKPFLAGEYKKTCYQLGDPFLLLIPPKEQFCKSYRVIHPDCKNSENNSSFYTEQYITLVIPKSIRDSVYINSLRNTQYSYDIPNSDYCYKSVRVSAGIYELRASQPFGVYIIGYGYADSYGYVGGLSLKTLLNAGPIINYDRDCYSVNGFAYRGLAINPDVDTLKFIQDSSLNVTFESKKLSADSINFQVKLIDKNFDGKAVLNAYDTEGNITYETIGIPGLTISGEPEFTNVLKGYIINQDLGTIDVDLYNYGGFSQQIISASNDFPTYFKTEINPQSLAPGAKTTIKVTLLNTPASAIEATIKVKTDCGEKEIAKVKFSSDLCDYREFNFPNFADNESLKLLENSAIRDSVLFLTRSFAKNIGGVWFKEKVPVKEGFTTEFSFVTSKGNNGQSIEKSEDGADGFALVIQNNDTNTVGGYACGIGYEYIKNAVALEFDLFCNNSSQIIDIADTNGNHIALMVPYNGALSPNHLTNQFAVLPDVVVFKHDTKYFVTINYSRNKQKMEISIKAENDPQIYNYEINGFDLTKYVKLENDYFAYVGFTAATGNAFQEHRIHNWHFCPKWSAISSVEEDNFDCKLSEDQFSYALSFSSNDNYSVKLYNITGELVKNIFEGELNSNSIQYINKKDLAIGNYYLVIKTKSHSKTYNLNIIR